MTLAAQPGAAGEPVVRFEQVGSPPRNGYIGLKPLSFSLFAGGQAWLAGPLAAGGRLALELIAVAAPPPVGRMALFGAWADETPRRGRPAIRRRMGLVFKDLPLAEALSVLDNLALAGAAAGRQPEAYLPPARELLDWVGLRQRETLRPQDLDPEGRWRLALARALVNGPELLLLDDLGAGLAWKGRLALFKLAQSIRAAGVAVLIGADRATIEAAADPGAAIVALDAAEPAPSAPSR